MKRPFFYFCVLFLLVISLAACTRSKSTSPVTSPEAKEPSAAETAAPGSGTMQVMDQLYILATQTAQAAAIQAGGQPPVQPGVLTPVMPGEQAPAVPVEPTAQPPAVVEPTAMQPQVEQPTAAPIAFPSPTPGIPQTWVVQGGEFAYCLARRYNVNPVELLSLNGLGSQSLLTPGMTLKIPQTGNTFPGARALLAHPTTYTVNQGDTIYSISCQFGDVDPNTLAAANGLQAPFKLTAGQTLQIP